MIIIYTNREDSKLHIVIPVAFEQLKTEIDSLTEENYMEFILNKDVPKDAINPVIVPTNTLPIDVYFRNAWYQDGIKIKVNIEIAREIHLNNLRIIRNKKLNELDNKSIQSIEKNDGSINDIIIKKQQLRDFHVLCVNHINHLNTLDEIKNFIPQILLE